VVLVGAITASRTILGQAVSARYSQVRIYISGPQDIVALSNAGLLFDHIDFHGTYFDTVLNGDEMQLLRNSQWRFTTLVDDVQAAYRARPQLSSTELKALEARMKGQYHFDSFGFGTMGGYYTYNEVVAKLDEMRAQHPNLISVKQSIGSSIENRPLWMVKISDNPDVDEANEEEILYTGLTHAREPQGMASVVYFMFYLLENYGTDPLVTYLVNNRQLYFVPVVNPDGYVYNQTTNPSGGGMWRKNRRNNGGGVFGIDLNRNFDYQWGINNSGSSPTPSSEEYRGASPASEPETQAIQNLAIARHFTMAFNYHSYANSLNFPWGYQANLFTPDQEAFLAFSQEMSRFNNYEYGTVSQTLGYTANGYSNDWFYGQQTLKGKVFSWTVEVGPNSVGFWPPQNQIVPLAVGNIYNNLVLAWGVNGAPPAFDITATPNSPPIVIPSQGGSFTFHVQVQNNSGSDQTVRVWNNIVRNDAKSEPSVNMQVPIAHGQTFSQDFTQNIANSLPAGQYTYIVNVGLGNKPVDSQSFTFQKQ